MEIVQEETKAYSGNIVFKNTVTEKEDSLQFTAFVKSISEIEEKAKKLCGEDYMFIESIYLLDTIILD